MKQSLVTKEMRRLVGVDYPPVIYDVDRSVVRVWARAVGYSDPIFFDEEVAKAAGHPTIPAPPGFLGQERFAADAAIGAAGAPLRGLNPQLTRSLNGATSYEYAETVYVGDVLVATTCITGFEEHEGSLGPMLIINRETTFGRDGHPIVLMRASVINY